MCIIWCKIWNTTENKCTSDENHYKTKRNYIIFQMQSLPESTTYRLPSPSIATPAGQSNSAISPVPSLNPWHFPEMALERWLFWSCDWIYQSHTQKIPFPIHCNSSWKLNWTRMLMPWAPLPANAFWRIFLWSMIVAISNKYIYIYIPASCTVMCDPSDFVISLSLTSTFPFMSNVNPNGHENDACWPIPSVNPATPPAIFVTTPCVIFMILWLSKSPKQKDLSASMHTHKCCCCISKHSSQFLLCWLLDTMSWYIRNPHLQVMRMEGVLSTLLSASMGFVDWAWFIWEFSFG